MTLLLFTVIATTGPHITPTLCHDYIAMLLMLLLGFAISGSNSVQQLRQYQDLTSILIHEHDTISKLASQGLSALICPVNWGIVFTEAATKSAFLR